MFRNGGYQYFRKSLLRALKFRRLQRRGLSASSPGDYERMLNPARVTLYRAGFGGKFAIYRGVKTDARARNDMFAKCEKSGDISWILKYRWAAERYAMFGVLPRRFYVAALSFFLRKDRLPLGAAK